MADIYITKASGEKSRFSEEKLRASLKRAGANHDQVNYIIKEITANLYEGMSTKKIYGMAFKMLREGSRHMAARYHLKQAIMELGPSGFPFEKYIAEILNCKNYKTETGQVLQGKCVTHEIDVIAQKDSEVYLIECKYHNQAGKFTDVQVPLYIQSRFRDVEYELLKNKQYADKILRPWVVTNTRFSIDALRYGTCMGMNLLAWDYPVNYGLKEQIDELGLYPLTCLTSLTKSEKQLLLDRRIVLCREIHNNRQLLESLGIKPNRISTIMMEAEQLCEYHLSICRKK